MNTIRATILLLAFVGAIGACGHAIQRDNGSHPSVARSNQCPETSEADLLPWKTEDLPDNEECRQADSRIRQGAALLKDFNTVRICMLWDATPEQADRFIEQMDTFSGTRIEPPQRFFALESKDDLDALSQKAGCLPKEFVEEARADLQTRAELKENIDDSDEQPNKVVVYIAPKYGLGKSKKRHGPGTKWGKLDTHFGKGHYDMTTEVASTFVLPSSPTKAFSPEAVALMADASQDIDVFCWTRMPPHAQTTVVNDKLVPTKETQEDWARFIMHYVNKAAELCRRDDVTSTRNALYELGFATHAVQDLSAHQGRTNEEHSFESWWKKDPDKTDGAYQLGQDMTRLFWEKAMTDPLKACAAKFSTYKGGSVPYEEKEKLLGAERDHSLGTQLEYQISWLRYSSLHRKNGDAASVRWLTKEKLPTKCDTESCRVFIKLIFESKPLAPDERRNHCFERITSPTQP